LITIYHNPRCSKSGQGLAIVEESCKDFQVIKYLDNPLSEENLTELIKLLGISPIAVVRKNEAIWKENYKCKKITDAQVVKAIVQNPKLLDRPSVMQGKKP
jgi:arsenate reductase